MFLKFSIYSGSRTEWNDLVSKFDNLTMYQIYEWGKIKESNGWSVIRLIGKNNGKPVSYTQIFHRKVFGVNIIIISLYYYYVLLFLLFQTNNKKQQQLRLVHKKQIILGGMAQIHIWIFVLFKLLVVCP